jgi:fatty-acyl-CoA synthase
MSADQSGLSYASGTADRPLLAGTIGAWFTEVAATHPDRDALVEHETSRKWTYAELKSDVDALAGGLLGLDVQPGDRIGMWSPNRAEWVITQLAAARIGAVLVNINPAYGTHELRYVLNQSGVSVVVAPDRFRHSDYSSMLAEVRADCPTLRHTICMDSPQWPELLTAGRSINPAHLTEVTASLRSDDPINIQYTSGTTGFPKGATLSHHNILNNGYFVGELCGYTELDRVCVPVPFFHCFGMVMGTLAAISHGVCVVIPGTAWDARETLAAVAKHRCTSRYGVPTMFIAELAEPDFPTFDLTSLRTGIMSGSPCPVEVMRQVVDQMGMKEVTICYGMTETAPVATQTREDDGIERRVTTVGRPGPHVEIKVVDPADGRTTPRGVPGEVCIRGYSVMLGYWNEPAKTEEAIDRRGWMHTGDLGTMDADGYLSITGRIKDMVIRGGENLYPREIEEFLHTHPDIVDVQVVGVPDPRYGDELMAWVVLRPGVNNLTRDDLRTFCRGRLAHHKVPRYVHVVDGFPMTASGKPRKVEMREIGIKMLGLAEPA